MAKVSSRCLHYLLAAMLEDSRGPPTWRLHTRLCNIVRNISTNISTLGQRTYLKRGEQSSLFIVYNTVPQFFLLYPMLSFLFYFLLRDNAHTLLAPWAGLFKARLS